MEETLHSQAYQILLAVREKGITMKKLAEILCIPHYMARSVIRFFDTNKIGRLISVDYLKQKVQKWVNCLTLLENFLVSIPAFSSDCAHQSFLLIENSWVSYLYLFQMGKPNYITYVFYNS